MRDRHDIRADRITMVPMSCEWVPAAIREQLDVVEAAVDADPTFESAGGQRYLQVDGVLFAPERDFGFFWGWMWTLTAAMVAGVVGVALADAAPGARIPWVGLALLAVVAAAGARMLSSGIRLILRTRRHGRAPRAGRYVLRDGYLIRSHPWRHRASGELRSIQWIPWSAVERVEIERHRAGGPVYHTSRWTESTRLVFAAPADSGHTTTRSGIPFDRGGRPLHDAIATAHAGSRRRSGSA